MSLPEAMLWQRLRRSQLGVKVRRQHPIGPYVVDFYIRVGRLVIEIDGEVHNMGERPHRDAVRDAFLVSNGHHLLRIAAVEVMKNIDGALDAIHARLRNPLHHPSDGPPPRAGEEL